MLTMFFQTLNVSRYYIQSCLLKQTCIYWSRPICFRSCSSATAQRVKKLKADEAETHVCYILDVWPVRKSPAACPWWWEKARPSTSASPDRSPERGDAGEPIKTKEISWIWTISKYRSGHYLVYIMLYLIIFKLLKCLEHSLMADCDFVLFICVSLGQIH